MIEDAFGRRRQILLTWMKGRLGERKAVMWATKELQRSGGTVSKETIALLDHLDGRAAREPDLDPNIRAIWHRLHVAARDRSAASSRYYAAGLERAIRNDEFGNEDVHELIEFVRPRLKAIGATSLDHEDNDLADDPRRWVAWDLEAASGPFDRGVARIASGLPRLSMDLLSRLIRQGTEALEHALGLARQLGWIEEGRDLANSFVARVSYPVPPDAVRRDRQDPDTYHDGFAPLVRLLTAAFDAIADKDPSAAKSMAALWQGKDSALFLRMKAYVCWRGDVCEREDIAGFLESLHEQAFWQWSRFPEVASLRALRWRDVPEPDRARLLERLIAGPKKDMFGPDDDFSEETRLYWRDHELARLTDNNEDTPEAIRRIVLNRRDGDPEFPAQISAIDPGRSPLRISGVPPGNPAVFAGVAENDLIATLAQSIRNRRAGDADDAVAYAQRNRLTLVEGIERHTHMDEDVEIAWRLLLEHPEGMAEEPDLARAVAERLATLALRMAPEVLSRLASSFCYWLDATDKQVENFIGSVPLWQLLIPLAVESANIEAIADEADLTTKALNAPLGHLISFFIRRCPDIPWDAERPPLPEPFAATLKGLEANARALMANRIAIQLNYFWVADRAWVEELVLGPMLSESKVAVPLWEAFAKYADSPRPDLWVKLERPLLHHVAEGRLSKGALDCLVQMAVGLWAHSKRLGAEPEGFDASRLRGALTVAPEDVRNAAAWRFYLLFSRDRESSETNETRENLWPRLGQAFFDEVWPMEPTAQSSESAKTFARLPVRVMPQHFPDAIRTVLPYLRSFEIWDVGLDFGLDNDSVDLLRQYRVETLALVWACVSDEQRHPIYHLGWLLSEITDSRPDLDQNPMIRRLRRLVAGNDQ